MDRINIKNDDFWLKNSAVIDTFIGEYVSIAKVNLETGLAVIIKSEWDPVDVEKEVPWQVLLERYVQQQVYKEDQQLIMNLTQKVLDHYYMGESSLFPIEFRCLAKDKLYDWVRITANKVPAKDKELLLSVKVINEDRVMRKIVELYVYQTCDFVVLIDASNNTYTMFSGKQGTPLPPETGNDYEAEVKRYNKQYVVPEEYKAITANMMINHVKKMLNEHEVYEFTSGFVNDDGQYRRCRVQFQYYDREAELIISTRLDVTKIYIDEGEKEKKLAKALREAQHDQMTNLYNKKATTELISSALIGRYRAEAVLFFIDIDNFKQINDTLGHPKGDVVLRYIGNQLAKIANKDGIAGRVGGDEFLLFLPVTQGMEQIKYYAQEICDLPSLKEESCIDELDITCSVGMAVYPYDGIEYDKLLNKADKALYNAKRSGKNKYSFYKKGEKPVE